MLGRPPLFPRRALTNPLSKLFIFYHYLFVFYTSQPTEPPPSRSGAATWKQQCRGEKASTRTNTNRSAAAVTMTGTAELLGTEPTKPSNAPGPAQTCDPPTVWSSDEAESSCFTRRTPPPSPANADKTRSCSEASTLQTPPSEHVFWTSQNLNQGYSSQGKEKT